MAQPVFDAPLLAPGRAEHGHSEPCADRVPVAPRRPRHAPAAVVGCRTALIAGPMAAMNVCVVGAGVFGLAAALELRRRGHEVELIERGTIPNPEASSTDVAKKIRRTGYRNEIYVELVTRAAAQWQEWQERTGSPIYFRTGALLVVRGMGPDDETLAGFETLSRLGTEVAELTATEAQARFPQFAVSDEDRLFHDPWAGYLRSGRALADLAALARAAGVTLREHTRVTAVAESAAGVTIRVPAPLPGVAACAATEATPAGAAGVTSGGHVAESGAAAGPSNGAATHRYDRAVVAAGPWVAELLPALAPQVRITRQQMAFFAPRDPAPFVRGRFPAWTMRSPGNLWYGFPYLHEGFVKVAEDSKVDDAAVDVSREPTGQFLDWARAFVARRIPALADAPLVGGRSCLYTNMADPEDEQFVIDWAPGCERVLIAGCGCGHGFKFGGAIGPVIADALEERANRLGDPFRIDTRFERGRRGL